MRILYVENHAIFATTVVAEFLRGHDVTVAPTAAEARAHLQRAAFDVILVDYDLDDEPGEAFIRDIRTSYAQTSIVAVSAHDDGNEALLLAGADAACPKAAFRQIEPLLHRLVAQQSTQQVQMSPSAIDPASSVSARSAQPHVVSRGLRVRLHLVDINPKVVEAWRTHFAAFPEVRVLHGDLLQVARHVAIAPANSQGFMDGGIDRAYADFFGPRLAGRVRDTVLRQPEGCLPIGAAVLVPTEHPAIPYLILAPTMSTPEHVPAANAYRALRAALRLSGTYPELDGDWFCPGLTTLVGGVDPEDAAREMAEAYHDWKKLVNMPVQPAAGVYPRRG